DNQDGSLAGTRVLKIPADCATNDSALEYEAGFLAETIRSWIDSGATVPRTAKELEQRASPTVCPGDVLIIARKKEHLTLYAQALERVGVAARVTGGGALKDIKELSLLHRCLCCVTDPEDPVALVAVLRSGLFGISDPALYEFKRSGGVFSF